jgi:L-asparaginase
MNADFRNQPFTLRIITAGGTIDKTYFDKPGQYEVGEPQVIPLLAQAGVTFAHCVEEAFRLDSLQIQDADRTKLRERVEAAPETHILITHGTDTMTDTAERLQGIPGKIIVLTGAMQPAKFHTSDAAFNLGCAVAAVQLAAPGVYIAMNGQVYPAGSVRKNVEKGRFEWV